MPTASDDEEADQEDAERLTSSKPRAASHSFVSPTNTAEEQHKQ